MRGRRRRWSSAPTSFRYSSGGHDSSQKTHHQASVDGLIFKMQLVIADRSRKHRCVDGLDVVVTKVPDVGAHGLIV